MEILAKGVKSMNRVYVIHADEDYLSFDRLAAQARSAKLSVDFDHMPEKQTWVLFAVAGEGVPGPLAELPPPAVQHVRAHLQRPRRLTHRYPLFQPPHRGQFELFGELPTRQSHDSILHLMNFES